MTEPRNLYYFPWEIATWTEQSAPLSPLARAALVDLRGAAWGAVKRKAPPCSLPDDDTLLCRMARLELRDWRKVRTELRATLTARDGVLVDDYLLGIWTAQHAAYERRATAGQKGGKARAATKQSPSNAVAETKQQELEREGAVEALPLTGQELLPAPAPDGDPAPADAAPVASGANTTAATGRDYLDMPATREFLARLGRRPEGAVVQCTDVQEREAGRVAWESHYHVVVADHAVAWIDANREAARAIGFSERARLGLPQKGELPDFQATTLRACVYEKIRERNGWPSLGEWNGRETFDGAADGALEGAAS